MIQLFTKEEFDNAKGIDKLPLQCKHCGKTFYIQKKMIKYAMFHNEKCSCEYCSKQCAQLFKKKRIKTTCEQCGKEIEVKPSDYSRSKSKHFFCSKSCAAFYNNTHKNYGFTRSKLEIYLESKLNELYPQIEILYNDRKTINSELDIFIPKYNLAFELNGIVHYEPIYGKDTFEYIQNRDKNKFQLCQEKNISLCIIDTSSLKYFKEQRAEKYLNIIKEIINQHLLTD
jgi:hypothetical protein